MIGGTEARHANKLFHLYKTWGISIVDEDGEHELGKVTGATARKESTTDPLTETRGGKEVNVLSMVSSETLTVNFAAIELMGAVLESFLMADGRAPTIKAYEQMRRIAVKGEDLVNDDLGDPSENVNIVSGIPQAHTAVLFPPPTSPTLATQASPAGTWLGQAYYAFIIPITVDQDAIHGFTAKSNAEILAILTAGTWNRGAEYMPHTPSASATATITVSHSIDVGWAEPTTGPRPTHYVIVVSDANDLTDASAKIGAVVSYGTTAVNIPSPGTKVWGAVPVLADTEATEIISVTAEVNVYTAATLSTGAGLGDYSFNRETGVRKRISASSSMLSGTPNRKNTWVFSNPTRSFGIGGSSITEKYVTLRLRNLLPTGTDPETRRDRGMELDIFKVNIAGLAQDLLTTGDDGWHTGANVSMEALLDSGTGEYARVTGRDATIAQSIDWFSSDIARKAAA